MTMSINLPSELQDFIRAEVSDGVAVDETEFLSKAVELYRHMKERHAELLAQVERSREQARRGDVAELDIEEIIDRGTERLAQEGITD